MEIITEGFFHALAIINKRKNYITSLKDDSGFWLDSLHQIKNNLLEKLLEVYTSLLEINYRNLFSYFHSCIAEDENLRLCTIPSVVENFKVVKSMHPTKALSLDEMPAVFYQQY